MCVVSMVSGHFQERWPKPQDFPPSDWFGYQELLRKAREYDRIHQQKDCIDPSKAQWERALEKYMKEKYDLDPKK